MDSFAQLSNVAVFRELPEGEELGGHIEIDGRQYVVTQRELDRIRNLPSADEVNRKVEAFKSLWLNGVVSASMEKETDPK